MGVSTNAIYGWGIAFSDEDTFHSDAFDAMWSETFGKKSSVEVFTHCSGDYPMLGFGVCIVKAHRGNPEKIEHRDPPEDAAKRVLAAIKRYADKLEDDYADAREKLLATKASDLGWFICSDWC